MGRLAGLSAPPILVDRVVQTFVRLYAIDLDEAIVPEGGFRSFNEFFTRRLRSGARPLDPDPGALISPADGRLDDMGAVDAASVLRIKGRDYRVQELLADPDLGQKYRGGWYFIVYLSPRDYHRVHAPVSGPVQSARYVPGTLYPVNAIGTEHVEGLFARNERVVVTQQSERFGVVSTVMVGAIGVGRIGLSFDDIETNVGLSGGLREYGEAAPRLERGDELGVFNLGSTVIVFVEPGRLEPPRAERGEHVRMGSAIGIASATLGEA